jgi:hypothetical protein
MIPIKDSAQFNDLLHNQVKELFRMSERLAALINNNLEDLDKLTVEDFEKVLIADPQYDLKNHYL